MKRCERFHIKDVEHGDRLHFDGKWVIDRWDGPREFDIQVWRAYNTANFGWVIVSKDSVPLNEEGAEDHFYLNDDWVITEAEK